MFGLGLVEIIIIAVAILVFIKPDDLPKLMYKVGKLYGKAQRLYNDFKNQVERLMDLEQNKDETLSNIPNKEDHENDNEEDNHYFNKYDIEHHNSKENAVSEQEKNSSKKKPSAKTSTNKKPSAKTSTKKKPSATKTKAVKKNDKPHKPKQDKKSK